MHRYPDYTFRPKAKRLEKKSVTKKKDSATPQPVTDANNYSSAARTRPLGNPVSYAIDDDFNNDITPVNAYTIFNAGSINANMTYATGYNNYIQGNAMYSDDVLFKIGDSTNIWDTTFQSSDQIMAGAYPSLVGTQTNYYGTNMYFPEPLAPAAPTATHGSAIDPMVTMMPSSSSGLYGAANFTHDHAGYMNTDGQLYPRFDCQVTPQSQMLSTPRLGYHGSPSSPGYDLYDDPLPTAVLSPFATPNNDFLSPWNNNTKFEDTNLFGDCSFWNNNNASN